MAHAGTPSDFAARPATSGSTGAGLWQALLVIVIAIAVVMAVSFFVSKPTNGAAGADRGYDQIENMRGAANFSVVAGDRSYDQIENTRGAANFSVVAGDHSYDQIENLRGTGLSATPVNHRYHAVKSLSGNLR